jgi:hypothetical protein
MHVFAEGGKQLEAIVPGTKWENWNDINGLGEVRSVLMMRGNGVEREYINWW